ncbi:smoothelin-like protein 1 isoform X2 [Dromiciops gliroides]|uniref:smoothelin-like protein 1 isoform X2 n=1 Tax=Dromiciops gliroides TaxID=33562 RepID=UPI001CC6B96F|nr:smoothelin-like protein 1 isoform X2 [Dromiciops gliroides]
MELENGKPLQDGTAPSTPTHAADTSGTVGNGCSTEEESAKDMAQKMSDKDSAEVVGAEPKKEEKRTGEAQSEAKIENDEEAKSDPKKEVDAKEEAKSVPQGEAGGEKEAESELKKEADGKEGAKSEPKEEADGKEGAKSEPKEEADGKEGAKSEPKEEADGKEGAKSEAKEEADGKEGAKSEPKEEADGKEGAKSEAKKGNDKEEAKHDSIEETTKESEKENKETSGSELETETISDTQVTQDIGGTEGEPGHGAEKEQGEGSGAMPSSPEEWPESPTGEGQELSPDTIGPESPTTSDSCPSDVPQSPTGPPPSEEKKKEKPSEYRVSAPSRPRGPRAQNKKAIMDKFGGAATGPAPLFRNAKAAGAAVGSVRNMLLEWCRAMTRNYEHVDIQNFSSSWSSGMAFCALIHKFFPDSFDYTALDPKKRRENFTLAFSTAENLADCAQLLEVDDMVRLSVPDSKCVYTYIQELYRSLVQKGLVKTKKK